MRPSGKSESSDLSLDKATADPPALQTLRRQIACADVIMLNKIGDVDETTESEVMSLIQYVRQFVMFSQEVHPADRPPSSETSTRVHRSTRRRGRRSISLSSSTSRPTLPTLKRRPSSLVSSFKRLRQPQPPPQPPTAHTSTTTRILHTYTLTARQAPSSRSSSPSPPSLLIGTPRSFRGSSTSSGIQRHSQQKGAKSLWLCVSKASSGHPKIPRKGGSCRVCEAFTSWRRSRRTLRRKFRARLSSSADL